MTMHAAWNRRKFVGATAGILTGLGLIRGGLWLRGASLLLPVAVGLHFAQLHSTRFARRASPCDHVDEGPDHHAELPTQYLKERGVRNWSFLVVEPFLERG